MKSKDFLKIPVKEITSPTKYYFLTKRKRFVPNWFYRWLVKNIVQVNEWPSEELSTNLFD